MYPNCCTGNTSVLHAFELVRFAMSTCGWMLQCIPAVAFCPCSSNSTLHEQANRRLLTAALPFPDIPDLKILAAVVQETIFSQLLRLPESELGVLAYAKVTVSYLLIARMRHCNCWEHPCRSDDDSQSYVIILHAIALLLEWELLAHTCLGYIHADHLWLTFSDSTLFAADKSLQAEC